jgi:Tol biopolymer transport system component
VPSWEVASLLLAYQSLIRSISVNRSEARIMADFTKEWIEHLKGQIAGRLNVVADKVDPKTYDELVTDLAWFTFRFARDPDTKMRKVFR